MSLPARSSHDHFGPAGRREVIPRVACPAGLSCFPSGRPDQRRASPLPPARCFLLWLPLAAFLLSSNLRAQEPDSSPPEWQALLAANDLVFTWPASGEFRLYRRLNHDFQPTDLALWSRRARTEIRLLIQPYDTTSHRLPWPHLEASRLVTHLADNQEDSVIAAHDLDPAAVRQLLNAHWARMYFFPPKPAFAPYQHCRMLCLYREGVATAYVFYLFDEAPAALDDWLEILRFVDPPEKQKGR